MSIASTVLASQALSSPPRPGVAVIEIPTDALHVLTGKMPNVTVLVVPPSALQPEFIRLPKAKTLCPITCLPRTTLLELLRRAGNKVTVRHLRKPGSTSGVTLIHRQSLVDYINSLPAPDWQDPEGEGEDEE